MEWIYVALAFSSLVIWSEGEKKPEDDEREPWKVVVPKDMKNCSLRYDTVYSWIVKIWNVPKKKMAGHGSMLTHKSALSTCKSYQHLVITDYQIIAQNIWNLSNPFEPCSQTGTPGNFLPHPKCDGPTATFFDFGLWVLKEPFVIQGPSYPTLAFPNSPYELLTTIHYINMIPNTNGCDLPYFENNAEKLPKFYWKTIVASIPWHTKCIGLLCEKKPADQSFTRMCTKRFGERSNGTMLCMYPLMNKTLDMMGEKDVNWYAGTPLVCNGSMLGIASQVKYRNKFPSDQQDFHLVPTLLRCWQWMLQMKKTYAVPWAKPLYIEDLKLKPEEFKEPYGDEHDTNNKGGAGGGGGGGHSLSVTTRAAPLFFLGILSTSFLMFFVIIDSY